MPPKEAARTPRRSAGGAGPRFNPMRTSGGAAGPSSAGAAQPSKAAQRKKAMEDARRAEEEANRFARASMLGERLRPLWDSDRVGAWEAPETRKDMPIDFCWPAHTWGYTMVDVVRTILKDECKREKVEWETARKPEFLKTGKRVAYIEGYKLWFQSARAPVDTIENQLLALTRNPDNGKTSGSQPYVTMTDAAVARSASDAFGTCLLYTSPSPRD